MEPIELDQPEHIHQVLVTDAARFVKWDALEMARELLGQGLVMSEGELHRRQRQLLQPVFQARRVELFAPVIVECTRGVMADWPERGTISAAAEMGRLALQVVGQTLFGTDLGSDVSEVRAAMGEAIEVFRQAGDAQERCQSVRRRLDRVVDRMIEEHLQTPRDDLLGRMVLAFQSGGMDERQLRDEATSLFLVGHETTAYGLTFALYLLSRHPEEQERCRHDPEVLRGAVLETLRLYPPSWILGRTSLSDTEIGGQNLPAGCTVTMSQLALHRDPRFFEEPHRFWPERWIGNPRSSLPRGCYFPFGAGPRVCIGEHFAWLEMTLGLSTILESYRLGLCPVEQPEVHLGITLAPDQELPVPVERI